MKAPSHDLRPRHVRYVPTRPKRRIPVLRVLLILGIGAFAYSHFDRVWKYFRTVKTTLTTTATPPTSLQNPTARPWSLPAAPRACLRKASANVDADSKSLQWRGKFPAVFPVLPGRITRVDSVGMGQWEVEIYHGRELYSLYSSLRRVTPGLRSGSDILQSQSLGEAASLGADMAKNPSGSGPEYAMTLRLERAGMPQDPRTLLPLEAALVP